MATYGVTYERHRRMVVRRDPAVRNAAGYPVLQRKLVVVSMTHAQMEAFARQLCESRRGAGAYDRKGCKRAYWRRVVQELYANVLANPVAATLWRACGWPV